MGWQYFLWGGKNAVYDDMILHTDDVRTTQVSYFEIFICSYAPSEKEHCALHFLRIAFFIDPSLRVPTGIEFALSIKPKR